MKTAGHTTDVAVAGYVPYRAAIASLPLAAMLRIGLMLGFILSSGCSVMKPGNIAAVQPVSAEPRAGNVYLLRGFIGFWSTGLNQLTDEINASGVHANVYQDDQWVLLADAIKAKYA